MISVTGERLAEPLQEFPGSRLLSLEDSSRLAKALRARSVRDREHVRSVLQEIHSNWLAEWCGVESSGLSDSSVRIEEVTSEYPEHGDADVAMVFNLLFGSSFVESEIGAFRVGEKRVIAIDVASKAWRAWIADINRALDRKSLHQADGPTTASVSEDSPLGWSGALEVVFCFGSSEWRLRLTAAEVDFVVGAKEPSAATLTGAHIGALVPLKDALCLRSLTVSVELQPLTLTLGQLESLAVGDVVVLSHSLDLPAQLKVDTADLFVFPGEDQPPPLCQAWLGQLHGNMAVELHPAP